MGTKEMLPSFALSSVRSSFSAGAATLRRTGDDDVQCGQQRRQIEQISQWFCCVTFVRPRQQTRALPSVRPSVRPSAGGRAPHVRTARRASAARVALSASRLRSTVAKAAADSRPMHAAAAPLSANR